MRKLLTILSLFFSLATFAQFSGQYTRQDIDIKTGPQSWETRPACVWLPSTYSDSTSKNYALCIFLHGSGEASEARNNALLFGTGLPELLQAGKLPTKFRNPADGKDYEFIFVAPQANFFSFGVTFAPFPYMLDDVEARYRINTQRVYLTGLSAGAQGVITAVTTDPTFTRRIAAIAPISFTGYNHFYEQDSIPLTAKNYGIPVWAIVGTNDIFSPQLAFQKTDDLQSRYNSLTPPISLFRSNITGGTHSANTWDSAYSYQWNQNPNNQYSQRLYEWMLQYALPSPYQPTNVVVIGSSTAAGNGATVYDSSWVGRLQLYYRRNINDGLDTVVTNLAVPGTTSYEGLPSGVTVPSGRPVPNPAHNITKALSYNPKLVIVNYPSNDVANGYSEFDYMQNLRLIYHYGISEGARVFVATTQPRNSLNSTQRTQLKELLDSINAQFWDKSIDFFNPIVSSDGQNNIDPSFNADNTHPNDAGHRLLFNQVVSESLWQDAPHDTSGIITVTVTFATTPDKNQTGYDFAKLKYNKYAHWNLTQDDRGNSVYDMSAYEFGGIAPYNGILYPGIPLSDGATVRRKYFFGAGDVAANSYANTDTTVDWTANGSPGVFMTWSQVNDVLKRNWGLLNHGAFHGIAQPGAVSLGLNAQKNLALNANNAFRKLNALGTQYVMKYTVVPSNDPDYHSASEQMGYMGGTSENQFDNYIAEPAAEFINVGVNDVTNYIKRYNNRYIVQARRFKDLNASDAYLDYSIVMDTLIHQGTATHRTSVSYGIHYPDFPTFKKIYDTLMVRSGGNIWPCSLHEFYDYFTTAHNTDTSSVLSGNTMVITLNQRFVPEDTRWRDISLMVASNAVISNVSVTGADDYSYNPNTGLINIYKKKTTGFNVPLNYTDIPFSSGFVPLQADDIFIDNNYEVNADALVDGDTTVTVQLRPHDGAMIHTPYEVTTALDDYGPVIDTVYVHGNSTSGFTDSLFLVRNDDNIRVFIGKFIGGSGWQKFPVTDRFVSDRLIQASNSTSGYGSEIKIHATSYFPYAEQTFAHRPVPLGDMIGFDAHWWDFGRNGVDSFNALWPEKIKVWDSIAPRSIRIFQTAEFYQNASGSQYGFNPNSGGYFEDIILRTLKQHNSKLFRFGSVLGQTKAVTSTWNARDNTIQLRGTVVSYDDVLGYGRLTIRYTASTGAGKVWDKWWIDPVTGSAVPQASVGFAIIPSSFPVTGTLNVGAGINYHVGDSVVVSARHTSQLNFLFSNNNDLARQSVSTYDSLSMLAYRFSARRGTNPFATPHNPLIDPFLVPNDNHVGLGTQDAVEVMNEPNAWWVGYDDDMNGKELAPAMSKIYDNNHSYSATMGSKNADPKLPVSISGLAIPTTDLNRGVEFWSKQYRGFRPKTVVPTQPQNWRAKYWGWVDIPYEISQFHAYSYSGGITQFNPNGIQSGLAPETGIALHAVDNFVRHRNKYTPWAQVDVGEWGYDVNQSSPINAPDISPYGREEVRGAWCVRTILTYNVHGVDKAQAYRFFIGNENDTASTLLFSSMYFAHNVNNDPSTTRLEIDGRYLAQVNNQYGDFIWDSTLREDSIYCYRFKKDTTYMYAIWKLESSPNQAAWENFTEKAIFTNRSQTYNLALPNGISATTRHLQNFSTTMSGTSQTVSGGALPVTIDLKPVFIEVGGSVVPPNQAPSSDAGSDQSITLPTNTVSLTGSGSDVDGSIASVQWVQLSGPSCTIVTPNNSTTVVAGLTEGTYVFQLTVTDDDGATSSDTVTVVVNPAAGGYVRTYTNFVRYLFQQLGQFVKAKRKP